MNVLVQVCKQVATDEEVMTKPVDLFAIFYCYLTVKFTKKTIVARYSNSLCTSICSDLNLSFLRIFQTSLICISQIH